MLRFIFQYWVVLKLSFVIFFYLPSIGLSYSYYLDCRVWLAYLIFFFNFIILQLICLKSNFIFFVVVSLSYLHSLTCIFDMLTSQVSFVFPFFNFVFIWMARIVASSPFFVSLTAIFFCKFPWLYFFASSHYSFLFKLVH